MCLKAIDKVPRVLQYIPDYFITEKMLVNSVCPEFCEDYRKRKNLKKEIYLELLPIAWHPDRWRDWCIPEDEKNMELKDGVNEKVFKKGEYSGVE